jgi:hypothetical protein
MVRSTGALILAITLLLQLGCDPIELPPPVEGEPVFNLSGTVGDEPFEVNAGQEDYFMFTDAYPAGNDGYTAEGRLSKIDCPFNCAPNWQITFSDSSINTLEALLSTGLVSYQSPDSSIIDTAYHFNLEARHEHTGGESVLQHSWYVDDSLTTIGNSLTWAAQVGSSYNIKLETLSTDSCYSYTEQTLTLNQQAEDESCSVAFEIDSTLLDSAIIATYLASVGELPVSLLWQVQGAIQGQGTTVTVLPNNIPFTLCLNATYADGCQAETCQTVQPAQAFLPPTFCRNEIISTLSTDTNTITIPGLAGGVTIQYEPTEGELYDSNLSAQPADAYFRILEVEPFENNSTGQATLKLRVEFLCQLFAPDGTPWQMVQAEGVIAVALP